MKGDLTEYRSRSHDQAELKEHLNGSVTYPFPTTTTAFLSFLAVHESPSSRTVLSKRIPWAYTLGIVVNMSPQEGQEDDFLPSWGHPRRARLWWGMLFPRNLDYLIDGREVGECRHERMVGDS